MIDQRPEGYNSVHLPIVYKLSNTKFPTNTTDAIVNVNYSEQDGSYWYIETDADIKVGIQVLDWVKVEVNGVVGIYQVIKVYADNSIIINLKYSIQPTTFGTCQFYYQNYNTKVKVYAGLRVGHSLNTDKPTKLITTLNVVPDSNNVVNLNINEFLKTDIGILNNDISLSTLQNDIDAFTEFYIEYAESYDTSDGNQLSTYVSSYTSDSENYAIAVNSKLPFRNGNGGRMLAYEDGNQFLTTFEYPVLFSGNYFDVWFLNDGSITDIEAELYKNGALVDTISIPVDSKDEGVYRVEFTTALDEDQIKLTIGEGQQKTLDVKYPCEPNQIYLTWLNYLGGMDYWLFTAQKDYGVDIEDVRQTDENIFINWDDSYNSNRIKYDIKRTSRENILVRSQNLTLEQVQGLKYIKTSPLVQMYSGSFVNVLVDNSSFTVYSETEKLYTISFTISMTSEVPSQSL
jgi:hypothetical protein